MAIVISMLDEKRKKRNRQKQESDSREEFEIPPIDGAPSQKRREGNAPFEIPTIQGAPQTPTVPQKRPPSGSPVQKRVEEEQSGKVQLPNGYLAYLAEKEKQEKREMPESSPAVLQAAEKPRTNVPDLHSDVLLRAVEYAQILQPPKAYQYMMTRSVRGDWQNHR